MQLAVYSKFTDKTTMDLLITQELRNCRLLLLRYPAQNPQRTCLIDRTDGLAKHYGFDPSKKPLSAGRMQQDLVDHRFDVKLLGGWATLSESKYRLFGQAFGAYDNDFDNRNSLLVACSNYRHWDLQKQFLWSVISAQQGGGPVSSLPNVVRKQVVNLGTQAITRPFTTSSGFRSSNETGTYISGVRRTSHISSIPFSKL